jgi:hypothetical protein
LISALQFFRDAQPFVCGGKQARTVFTRRGLSHVHHGIRMLAQIFRVFFRDTSPFSKGKISRGA